MSRAITTLFPVLIEAFRRLPDDHAEAMRAELLAAAEKMPEVAPRDDAEVARLLALLVSVLITKFSHHENGTAQNPGGNFGGS